MNDTIICPHCKKSFPITEALKHQVEGSIKEELVKQIKSEVEETKSMELRDLKTRLKVQEEKSKEYKEEELKLRDENRRLELEKKDADIKIQRAVDQARKQIEDDVQKRAKEEYYFKEKEKDKIIDNLNKALDEARRKSSLGSQQLQGEVVEEDLEDKLRREFPNDEIMPVEKGVRGADVRQIVKSPRGIVCGVILWEAKRVKVWSDAWIGKLKNDLRAEKANIPVIITNVMPKEITSGMGQKDGVVVASYNLFLPLSYLLRKNLLEVGFEKAKATHRGEKADYLYEYITSHEFLQQVEAMLEVYRELKAQIKKERDAYERLWKMRDAQADRLVSSIANTVGSIQGKIGQSVLPVKGLDLLEGGEESKSTS